MNRGTLLLVGLVVQSALAAAPPDTRPADVSLGNGLLRLTPPPAPWEFSNLADKGTAAFYRLRGDTMMLISFVGGGCPRSPQLEQAMKAEVLQKLQGAYRRKNIELLIGPRAEPDARFWVVVHEKMKRPHGTSSQFHLYRNLPPHQVVVTVMINSDRDEEVQAARSAAEDVALSARLVPRGEKAPPPPSSTTPPRDDRPPPDLRQAKADLASAQVTLDRVSARCLSDLGKTPAGAAAQKQADAADANFATVRRQNPDDAAAIADAAHQRLEARSRLEALRQEALGKDPAVAEARRLLADARDRVRQAEKPR